MLILQIIANTAKKILALLEFSTDFAFSAPHWKILGPTVGAQSMPDRFSNPQFLNRLDENAENRHRRSTGDIHARKQLMPQPLGSSSTRQTLANPCLKASGWARSRSSKKMSTLPAGSILARESASCASASSKLSKMRMTFSIVLMVRPQQLAERPFSYFQLRASINSSHPRSRPTKPCTASNIPLFRGRPVINISCGIGLAKVCLANPLVFPPADRCFQRPADELRPLAFRDRGDFVQGSQG